MFTSALLGLAALAAPYAATPPQRMMETLDRGLVAVPAAKGSGNHVSWRLLATDAKDARFVLRRDGRVVARVSGSDATSVHDTGGTPTSRYTLESPGGATASAGVWAGGYLAIPLDKPADRMTPDGQSYGFTANDASVGDLDGDGRYELIVKWYPTLAKDNSQAGYTGETLLDAYTLEGKRLWRIDLGRNIRSGAHYTQFLVADFDGDGRAEVAMKTADGTIDGTGKVLGDAKADYRVTGGEQPSSDRTGSNINAAGQRVAHLTGRILSGPEYLSVFDGRTGRALATTRYWPQRHPDGDDATPEQQAAIWHDGYGNRSERYLAGAAWLDGKLPSMVFARGYYGRTTLGAWDWRDGKLTQRWTFDSMTPGNEKFGGQGNHQLAVADVDDDGRDEIIYGAMAIDDTGKGLWSTGLGHGDAMHVGDLDPTRPGLEKFGVHENMAMSGNRGSAMLDARTGEILWSTPATADTGRGVTADIDPRHPGEEAWSSNSADLYDARGQVIPGGHPRAANFAIWWDGDRLREPLDGKKITKWDWTTGTETALFDPADVMSNNGTKRNPSLSADILGDWREELVVPTTDSRELRIYTTPYPTKERIVTLMHDPVYRASIVWQNTAYNQPPHTGFYLGTK